MKKKVDKNDVYTGPDEKGPEQAVMHCVRNIYCSKMKAF